MPSTTLDSDQRSTSAAAAELPSLGEQPRTRAGVADEVHRDQLRRDRQVVVGRPRAAAGARGGPVTRVTAPMVAAVATTAPAVTQIQDPGRAPVPLTPCAPTARA